MTDTEIVSRKPDREPVARPPLVDAELADELLARAQRDGTELLGPEGFALAGDQGRVGAGGGR